MLGGEFGEIVSGDKEDILPRPEGRALLLKVVQCVSYAFLSPIAVG